MARQPRLAIGGLPHYVLLRARQPPVFRDETDRRLFVEALREAGAGVVVHALALTAGEAHLLLRPSDGAELSRAVQAVGRRFVAAYNRRHGQRGTPWDGRFRAAVVEPGAWTLAVLRRIDRLEQLERGMPAEARAESGVDEPQAAARWMPPAPERIALADPPELWALGNTPFDRESAYLRLLAQPLPQRIDSVIDRALRSGRVIGGDPFVQALERQTERPLRPRPRGRPRAGSDRF